MSKALSRSARQLATREAVSAALSDLTPHLDHDALRNALGESISATLSVRDVPPECLKFPRVDVVIPALDAVRYAPAVHAFGALIAYSMDTRTSPQILPAYVEMLRQLSTDELALLGRMPSLGRFEALANVVHISPNRQSLTVYRNIIPASYAKNCERPSQIPLYIDNLVRLNLLHKPAGQQVDEGSYRALSRLPFVRAQLGLIVPPAVAGLDKTTIGVSDLGEGFRRACTT